MLRTDGSKGETVLKTVSPDYIQVFLSVFFISDQSFIRRAKTMPFILRSLDQQAIRFEAMVWRAGEKPARRAFARALNHEGAKAHTLVKRTLRKETSIKIGDINRAVSFHKAGDQTLKTVTRATGAPIPLRYFGARQFKYGVAATVWGRRQKFPSAFIVKSLGGGVFKNTRGWNAKAKRFNAIEKLYGPSIPKEMLEDAVVNAFLGSTDHVATRAMHELNRILNS